MPENDPLELHANAWCGEEVYGIAGAESLAWGTRRDVPRASQPLAPGPLNLADWTDARVGWGVVLPDRDDVSNADKAQGVDLPEPIRMLVARRGNAPVFRYRADLGEGRLRRYAPDGSASDPGLNGKRGIAPDAIPYYLLLTGPDPLELPIPAAARCFRRAARPSGGRPRALCRGAAFRLG